VSAGTVWGGKCRTKPWPRNAGRWKMKKGLNKWNPVCVCVSVYSISSLWCILCFINKTLDARVYAFISKSCHQHTQSELSTFCSSLALKLLPLYIYVDCSTARCMHAGIALGERNRQTSPQITHEGRHIAC
jgi:hypothetical protein